MIQFLKIEFLSFIVGFRELIYSLAEKLDFRMKSFKLNLRGNLIEKELEHAYIDLGKKALDNVSKEGGLSFLDTNMFIQAIRVIQNLRDRYSLSLQELSDLQRQALRETLSHCSEQFQRTGWELAQIEAPDELSFRKIKIRDIPVKKDLLVLMIKKDNQMLIVNGDIFLEPGDTVICIGTTESLQAFKSYLNK
jgi:TrkA family protein